MYIRFFCSEAPTEASDFYAHWAASWLTSSSKHMKAAHTAVERLMSYYEVIETMASHSSWNWTLPIGCQSYYNNSAEKEQGNKTKELDFESNKMEIDSDLFFNLVDQFKKAKDEITALSMRLSVNNNAVTYTTKKKVIESNDDYEDEDK